jgi:hypothetical protein
MNISQTTNLLDENYLEKISIELTGDSSGEKSLACARWTIEQAAFGWSDSHPLE